MISPEISKAIIKKLIRHALALMLLLVLVLIITGIPQDFNIVSYNARNIPNMDLDEIANAVIKNFISFLDGTSLLVRIQGETAGSLLIRTASKSFAVLFAGSLLALAGGVLFGIFAARKKNTAGSAKLLLSLIPLSVPDLLTITLVHLFVLYLYNNGISLLGIPPIPAYGDSTIINAVYPAISISILPAAYIARITSGVIEEDMTKLHILAARAKGCSRFVIIRDHILKNVLYKILSAYPAVIGILFSSLVIAERLFYYKGMAFYLIFLRTSPLIPAYEAGVAFSLFVSILCVIYYLIYTALDVIKSILLIGTRK